ncbi:MAG: hypothetical protein K9I85_14945 [Saprospiraceae bacterium]|nr:hypothetical protein [Saprospiraceae bacterium]
MGKEVGSVAISVNSGISTLFFTHPGHEIGVCYLTKEVDPYALGTKVLAERFWSGSLSLMVCTWKALDFLPSSCELIARPFELSIIQE